MDQLPRNLPDDRGEILTQSVLRVMLISDSERDVFMMGVVREVAQRESRRAFRRQRHEYTAPDANPWIQGILARSPKENSVDTPGGPASAS